MTAISSYGKVYQLGHREVSEIFFDPVIIEEKVDGSQFSFQKVDGEVKFRSRNKEIIHDAPEKMFAAGVGAVKGLSDLLHDNWVYRGEYLSSPKHNALAYTRIPNNHIYLYDVQTGPGYYLDHSSKIEEAKRLGLEPVSVLAEGEFSSVHDVLNLLDRESVLGGQLIEGIVVKNYSRFTGGGNALKAKYVSERFKEIAKTSWRKANPTKKDVLTELTESLRTEARWEKAIQHLREDGRLTGEMKDIGSLVKEIQKDVKEECVDYIKEILYAWAIKDITRGCVRGFPEWYKKKLALGEIE